jgi:gamma-glutamyltranspeptidase/glutathione hydrolase
VLTAPSGPQSSISSSIAEDLHTGAFVMAAGSAGGSRIITATLQNLHHHLDQGLSANDTVHSARWHDQLTNVTYFEIAALQLGIAGIRYAFVCSPVIVTGC